MSRYNLRNRTILDSFGTACFYFVTFTKNTLYIYICIFDSHPLNVNTVEPIWQIVPMATRKIFEKVYSWSKLKKNCLEKLEPVRGNVGR